MDGLYGLKGILCCLLISLPNIGRLLGCEHRLELLDAALLRLEYGKLMLPRLLEFGFTGLELLLALIQARCLVEHRIVEPTGDCLAALVVGVAVGVVRRRGSGPGESMGHLSGFWCVRG